MDTFGDNLNISEPAKSANRRTIQGVNRTSLIRAACHLGVAVSHKRFTSKFRKKLAQLMGSKLIKVVNSTSDSKGKSTKEKHIIEVEAFRLGS